MRPESEMIPVLIDAAKALKGSQRRLFMAKTVKAMGRGGQRRAMEHLGWCRDTVRKGMHELDSGMTCVDSRDYERGVRSSEAQVQIGMIGLMLRRLAGEKHEAPFRYPGPARKSAA